MRTVSTRTACIAVAAALCVMAAAACGNGNNTGGQTAPASGKPTELQSFVGYKSKLYNDSTKNWICHPDLGSDPCRDLDTTVISQDGTRTVTPVKVAADPPIDCFYIYPVASHDLPPNADLNVDTNETDIVRAQVAPYSSVCRVFAPAYRQVPLTDIGSDHPAGAKLAYDDVLDAYKTYMTRFNKGRGVVLIGHSEGTEILEPMIAKEIDRQPDLRGLLVSAILMGGPVSVPNGKDVGGDFQQIPACKAASQTGCVISFMSFPANAPPTKADGSYFGMGDAKGREALCVNPVKLAGGNDLADPIMPNYKTIAGDSPYPDAATPFISTPGALKAQCMKADGYSFLGFSPAGPSDPRNVNRLLSEDLFGPKWGLHLVESNIVLGDLLQIVKKQGAAFRG